MADTGAPWNIPYAEPADLVRDWPALSEDVADAVAAGLTAAGNPGIGSNVVQAVKTDTFTTSSTSFTTVTGLSATITPSSTSSKVLVIAQITHGMGESNGYGHFKVTRGSTDIYIGNAGTGQIRAVFGGGTFNLPSEDLRYATLAGCIVFLDSPGVDTATTYNVQVRQATNGSVWINRSTNDSASASGTRGASSITLIEVAA